MSKWTVPIISQKTLQLCWEACGQMMWQWKYRKNTSMRNLYLQRAGNYAKINRGLQETQMNKYYLRLGMRSLKNPSGKNVRHALGWSPVIVVSMDQAAGHAMIVTNYSGRKYQIINPCAVQTVSFGQSGGDMCSAGTTSLAGADVDNKLGSYIWYW